jgi:hypothetical protein
MAVRHKNTWVTGLLIAASIFLLAAYVVPNLLNSANGDGGPKRCTPGHRTEIAHGPAPEGKVWRVTAAVKSSDGCNGWTLSLNFRPAGVARGSWEGSWEMPTGGHLPSNFTVAAQDDTAGSGRAFNGVVGSRVREVVLVTKSGIRYEVHPRLPSRSLRARFVWLRDFRYFMRFYPAEDPAKFVLLRAGSGHLILKVPSLEGSFEGPF